MAYVPKAVKRELTVAEQVRRKMVAEFIPDNAAAHVVSALEKEDYTVVDYKPGKGKVSGSTSMEYQPSKYGNSSVVYITFTFDVDVDGSVVIRSVFLDVDKVQVKLK